MLWSRPNVMWNAIPWPSQASGFWNTGWRGWSMSRDRVDRSPSLPSTSKTWWSLLWKRRRRMPRIGREPKWPNAPGCPSRRSAGFGRPLISNHIEKMALSCLMIHCLQRRSLTLSGCMWTRRSRWWCYRWMNNPRSKRCLGPSRRFL